MNVPNKLTVFRMALTPFLVFFLLCEGLKYRYIYALAVFLAAAYTDRLDGKIAREKGLITDFGKFADPLADKALIASAFVCFVQTGDIGAVPVIMTLIREFAVTSVRFAAAGKGKVVAANFWGKAKTLGQMLVVAVVIAWRIYFEAAGDYSGVLIYSRVFIGAVTWISVVLSWVSGIIYIYDNYKYIKCDS